ncbi:hypothetical protein BVC80_1803g35 [Macleaya cordata]|uniref:RNA-directed DNA polymerase, eukaryota, reverse transcriptase zinc-binding domain protein n=1 Tax=Macleaya cordata TaxID=56857 RepID=A0A200QR35_MACCD|nr:hypothetical protein BVC80_1803g35 [Macleaya cordata]
MLLGPRPFRFELMWLKSETLPALIEEWWSEKIFRGNPGYIFCKKLQHVKDRIKVWNLDTFGRVDKRMDQLLSKIAEIDGIEEQRTISQEEKMDIINHRNNFNQLVRLEDIKRQQKLKKDWIDDGERNTAYYHAYVNQRRRNNFISCLEVDGILTENSHRTYTKKMRKSDHL